MQSQWQWEGLSQNPVTSKNTQRNIAKTRTKPIVNEFDISDFWLRGVPNVDSAARLLKLTTSCLLDYLLHLFLHELKALAKTNDRS
eukprot:scaffold1269_cov261-Ochromonas_danica.AAC.1